MYILHIRHVTAYILLYTVCKNMFGARVLAHHHARSQSSNEEDPGATRRRRRRFNGEHPNHQF